MLCIKVFLEKLIDNISAVLSNDALASFPEKAAQVVANLPDFLSNTLSNQGLPRHRLNKVYRQQKAMRHLQQQI